MAGRKGPVEDERLVAVQAGMVELVEPGVEQVRHWKRMWEIWLVEEVDCSVRETTDNQQAHVPESAALPEDSLKAEVPANPTPTVNPLTSLNSFLWVTSFSIVCSIPNRYLLFKHTSNPNFICLYI